MELSVKRIATIEELQATFVEYSITSDEKDEDGEPIEFLEFRLKIKPDERDLPHSIKRKALQRALTLLQNEIDA